jgi:Flp pilus assembly pilin Flp
VEYALLVALIAVAAIVALGVLSDGINSKFDEVNSELT